MADRDLHSRPAGTHEPIGCPLGLDRFIRSSVSFKRWMQRLPTAEEVRPCRCPVCGAASRPEGLALVIHGHGKRARPLRGPPAPCPWGPDEVTSVVCRRFQCQVPGCGAVLLVGPAEIASRYRFFAPAIALALFLWSSGEPPGEVWARCTGFPKDRRDLPERWRSLTRWGRAALAGTLFPGVSVAPPHPGVVRRAAVWPVIERLLGRAASSTRLEADEIRVMAGAVHVM